MTAWLRFLLILGALVPAAPLLAAGPAVRAIHVTVEVDYGPKGKPPLKKSLTLKEGSTVVDATRATVDLKQGFVCCDPKDVETIGGVKCDPENEGWWLYDINSEKGQVSACRYLLADGDRIRWFYRVSGSLHKVKVPGYRVTRPGVGTVEGRVEIEGKVPSLPDYKVHKNVAYCGKSVSKPNPCRRSQDAGRLAMAVVWLSGVKEGKDWASAPPPRLDQRNCEFIPHLVVAPVGSTLTLTSQDSVLHTLHALDADHRTLFNLAMPDAGSRHEVTLSEKGVWDIQCDAGHRWMKAHLVVVDNPYWTLSAKDGSYRLEGVPPGTYTLNVWHDLYGLQSKEITVGAGDQTVTSVFTADQFRMDLRYMEAKE